MSALTLILAAQFIVRPVKDRRLGWVKAKFRTPSGEIIRSEW